MKFHGIKDDLDIEDLYDGGEEVEVAEPDTDVDIEIEDPGLPPVPKYPNPFTPPRPVIYPQPKARR